MLDIPINRVRRWDNIFELDFDGEDIVDVNDISAMVRLYSRIRL